MRQPCNNCPFLKSTKFYFTEKRSNEILYAITHDSDFKCHKTVDYSSDNASSEKAKLCFGSVVYLENTVSGGAFSNVMYRLGLRIEGVPPEDVTKSNTVYDSPEDFIEGNSI